MQLTLRHLYAVNTYAAEVAGFDVGPHIDLFLVQNLIPLGSLHEAAEGADLPKLVPDTVNMAARRGKKLK